MKIFVFVMCVFGSSLAAPALDSGSNEQASNANTALHLMELYKMIEKLQKQAAPGDAQSQIVPQVQQEVNPALLVPRGDGSDEENTPFNGFNPAHGFQPAVPLTSDEVEAAEEAEEAEAVAEPTEAAPVVETVSANDIPAVAVDVAVDVTVAAADPAPEVTAAPVAAEPAAVAAEPSAVPQEPSVAVETDITAVGPDAAVGAEQVVVADAPDTVLPVQ